jgi:hypothetical protein
MLEHTPPYTHIALTHRKSHLVVEDLRETKYELNNFFMGEGELQGTEGTS